jgi:hypothetical protein
MKYSTIASSVCVVVLLLAGGCTKPAEEKPAETAAQPAPKADSHSHGNGPNGGVVFDLGSHHAEFTVDHPKQEATILFFEAPVAATELVLNIQETQTAEGTKVAPMTVTLSATDAADGKASKFVGKDPGIGNVADFAGTVSGEIDGKPASGEFKE